MAMQNFRVRTLTVATGLALALALGPVLAAKQVSAEEQINVRFSWKLKGEYAPFYVALDQGYYAEEGLDVSLGEGAGAQAAIGGLLQGQEDLVVLPGAFALTAITQGMPIKMTALYHPAAPTVLISWPDNPVREPKDLEGKSVATAVGETGTTYMPVLCRRNDVDCDLIQMVQMAIQARVPQFIARQVDVVSVYESNDLPILEAMHETEFVVLDMPAYGLEIPGMSVVASNDALANRGDAFSAFLRATARGVETALADPTAAAEMMRNYWDTTLATEVIAKQIENTVVRIPHYEGKPYGWVDQAVIEDALDIMTEFGEIPEALPIDSYFTNELLERFAS
jgi:NitT/TauT family transport system substrate-binding protein